MTDMLVSRSINNEEQSSMGLVPAEQEMQPQALDEVHRTQAEEIRLWSQGCTDYVNNRRETPEAQFYMAYEMERMKLLEASRQMGQIMLAESDT